MKQLSVAAYFSLIFSFTTGQGGPSAQQHQQQQDYPVLFAQLIARTAKDIDVLIDSLPSEDSSPELQVAALRRLEVENQEAAQQLQDTVAKGEALLDKIQNILSEIANSQLKAQRMQHLRAVNNNKTMTNNVKNSSDGDAALR